jgi:hypothetical protein
MICSSCTGTIPKHSIYCLYCGTRLDHAEHKNVNENREDSPSQQPASFFQPVNSSSKTPFRFFKTLFWISIVCFFLFVLLVIPPNVLSARDRSRVKRTMADIRGLSTGWDAYAQDHRTYCPAGFQVPNFSWNNVSPAVIRAMLEPTYLRKIPTQDGWGRPYQFVIECTGDKQRFGIRSAGSDGVWATDHDRPKSGYDYDIVLIDGYFLHRPEGYCPR